jgi:hypothetical protein
VSGAWKEMSDEVNLLGLNVTFTIRNGGNTVRELLRGDLSARMTAQLIQGELRQFRENLNELAERYEAKAATTDVD